MSSLKAFVAEKRKEGAQKATALEIKQKAQYRRQFDKSRYMGWIEYQTLFDSVPYFVRIQKVDGTPYEIIEQVVEMCIATPKRHIVHNLDDPIEEWTTPFLKYVQEAYAVVESVLGEDFYE